MTLPELVVLGLKSSVVLTVLALGLTASPGDATSLIRAPAKLVLALLAMMVIVPILALVASHAFELEPAVAIAIGALSISPVPPLLVNKTRQIGGAATSYTIGLLVVSSLLAIPLIPLALTLAENILSIPLAISMLKVAELTLGMALVPLSIGMAIARFTPRIARRIARPVSVAGMALLVVGALPLVFKAWTDLTSLVGDGTMLVMATFCSLGLVAGHVLGGPSEEERSVLALATASRHPGIAIAIAQANFPDQKLVPAAVLLYLLVSAVVCFSYTRWHRHQLRPERPNRARVAVVR